VLTAKVCFCVNTVGKRVEKDMVIAESSDSIIYGAAGVAGRLSVLIR
jgi:hypothetical protein